MNFKEHSVKTLYKIAESLGHLNDARYAVVGIAACKGLFRPIFTLADKKQSKEERQYAATREGLTEMVAIPAYWFLPKLVEKLEKKVFNPELGNTHHSVKNGLTFIGVCAAAFFVIPFISSLAITPIMKQIKQKPNPNQNNTELTNKLDAIDKNPAAFFDTDRAYILNDLQNKDLYRNFNCRMKVGL